MKVRYRVDYDGRKAGDVATVAPEVGIRLQGETVVEILERAEPRGAKSKMNAPKEGERAE